jgi:cell division protein FtsI (penicillin-binding protein 3)
VAKPVVRIRAVQVAFGLGMAALVLRAAQVQLVRGDEYRDQARAQRTERVELPARRGTIYDRNGSTLALTQDVYHVGVAPNELRNRDEGSAALVRHLGLSRAYVNRQLRQRYAYFAGPYNSAQVQPLRHIAGVHLEEELTRFYPNPQLARSILGHPGDRGDSPRPASGIERVLDSVLTGRSGSAVVLRDQHGRRYASPSRLDAFPVPGHNVYLTIDAELQDLVDRALIEAIDRHDARGGDVVVMDPRTGEILAIASRRANGAAPPSAFTTAFEPGSTAKVFAAAALLARDLVDRTDSVWGEEGTFTMGSRTVHDEHPEGWMTLRDVLRRSSNIGMAKFVQRLEPEHQYETLRDFGIGTPTGVEFPSESDGVLRRPHLWSGTSAVSLAIGYELSVTMLQLTQAYAAIANQGVLLRPSVVARITDPDGDEVYRHEPEAVRRVITAETAAELLSMLRDVVYDGGTGESAKLTSYEVAGKTGTARRVEGGGYLAGAYTSTFASIFPADDPQLVMVVKLEDARGAYAQLNAAPLTRSVLQQVIAARTDALDRERLGRRSSVPRATPPAGTGTVPYIVNWPAPDVSPDTRPRGVPDVRNVPVRTAVQRLHQRGLQVRLLGWGSVVSVSPAPGTLVEPGSLVTIQGSERPRSQ